jgi:hypothetical protein
MQCRGWHSSVAMCMFPACALYCCSRQLTGWGRGYRWWGWRRVSSAGIRCHWDLAYGCERLITSVVVCPCIPSGRCEVVVGAAPCADMRPAGDIANEVAIGLAAGGNKACGGWGADQGCSCVIPPAGADAQSKHDSGASNYASWCAVYCSPNNCEPGKAQGRSPARAC